MHNLDDNELDRLSRDAAEGYEPEAAPPAWDSLQKRLDREMPTRKEGKDRKFWLLLLLLFLVAGGSTLFYYSGDHGMKTAANTVSAKATADKNIAAKSSVDKKDENGTEQSKSLRSAGASVTPDRDNDGASENTAANNQKASIKESFSSAKQPQFNRDRSDERVGAKTSKRNKTTGGAGSGAAVAFSNSRNSAGQSGGNSLTQNDAVISTDVSFYHVSELNADKKGFSFADLNEPNPKLKGAAPVNTYAAKPKDKKSDDQQFRPFEFGIIVGPDKSQVHGTKADNAGYNFGVSLAYNLSSRWQLNTGLIYNKKYYNAKGSDYHPPKGYWTDSVYLSMVNANCLMWDLPINVRYNILAKKNYSVFASAGVSSYFMKKEDYGYHYYYYGGQYGYRYKSTPTNKAYWFSVGNLSAGYEQNLGSFSIQAEPYVKIALKGVGMGSVDLNSYGMNIGLKYKPKWSVRKTNPPTK